MRGSFGGGGGGGLGRGGGAGGFGTPPLARRRGCLGARAANLSRRALAITLQRVKPACNLRAICEPDQPSAHNFFNNSMRSAVHSVLNLLDLVSE